VLPLAQPAAKIQGGDYGRCLLKAPVQVNPAPDLLGLAGRDVVGFQLPFREHRELILTMQLLAVGAAALGIATGTLALDERTREHFAQQTKTADEATAQLHFRIAGHKGLL